MAKECHVEEIDDAWASGGGVRRLIFLVYVTQDFFFVYLDDIFFAYILADRDYGWLLG